MPKNDRSMCRMSNTGRSPTGTEQDVERILRLRFRMARRLNVRCTLDGFFDDPANIHPLCNWPFCFFRGVELVLQQRTSRENLNPQKSLRPLGYSVIETTDGAPLELAPGGVHVAHGEYGYCTNFILVGKDSRFPRRPRLDRRDGRLGGHRRRRTADQGAYPHRAARRRS